MLPCVANLRAGRQPANEPFKRLREAKMLLGSLAVGGGGRGGPKGSGNCGGA